MTAKNFAKVYSAQTTLLSAQIIDIEVDLSKGLHSFSVVGLPDKAVEESRDRVSAAVKNSGFKSPKAKNQKIVISLAPADLKKEGPVFDLGIALAYLLSCDEIRFNTEKKLFLGSSRKENEISPFWRLFEDSPINIPVKAKAKELTKGVSKEGLALMLAVKIAHELAHEGGVGSSEADELALSKDDAKLTVTLAKALKARSVSVFLLPFGLPNKRAENPEENIRNREARLLLSGNGDTWRISRSPTILSFPLAASPVSLISKFLISSQQYQHLD